MSHRDAPITDTPTADTPTADTPTADTPTADTPTADTILSLAHRAAQLWPNAPAISDRQTQLSHKEVWVRAGALAARLVSYGVEPGDRVVIMGQSSPQTVVAFWATLRARAVACPAHPQTPRGRLDGLLHDYAPKAALVSSRHVAAWTAIAPAVTLLDLDAPVPSAEPPSEWPGGDALAAIITTSGSTGHPKGVMLDHANMRAAARAVQASLCYRRDDRIFSALALSFSYGLYQPVLAAAVGAEVLLETSFAWPTQTLDRMESAAATVFAGIPTFFARLSGQGSRTLPHIRLVTTAAAPLPKRHPALLSRLFPNAGLVKMYGQTECKRISWLPPEALATHPDSVGRAIPGTQAWPVDSDGRALPPGKTGELWVSGPHVMRGYWQNPAATQARLHETADGVRVLHTGDLFQRDEDGYLYFVARMDDIIISGGNKVPPREVEDALLEHPDIAGCAVVGIPDATLGQAILAVVVPGPGRAPTAGSLRRWCRQHLLPHMVPSQIRFRERLPLTTRGKIDKKELTR